MSCQPLRAAAVTGLALSFDSAHSLAKNWQAAIDHATSETPASGFPVREAVCNDVKLLADTLFLPVFFA